MSATSSFAAPPPAVLYAGDERDRAQWVTALRMAAEREGLVWRFAAEPDELPPETVEYLLFETTGPLKDIAPYTGLKAILSLWAGVDRVLARSDLPRDVPLTRMVEPGLTWGMTDYVVGHALRVVLRVETLLDDSRAGVWNAVTPPLAAHRRIGVMGLGVLGQDAVRAFQALRFPVSGWSRSGREIPGVKTYAGLAELDAFLSETDILVLLVPQTPETTGLMSRERLAKLPAGAHLINVARGPVVPEAALLAALDSSAGGQLGGATLDVFDVEPLAADHPYWRHPKILVTPHVASVTRPETAAVELVRQIKRHAGGGALEHVIDRARGY